MTIHTDNKETLNNALKRIAELERKLEQTEKDLTDYQFNYPKIKDLEKENAELKEKYDTYLRENTGLKIHNAYIEKKLTEAKEIIEEYINLDYVQLSPCDKVIDLRNKAENFLNSEVGK